MTRSKKQYYKVMQAKRQREVSDIANGILIRHVLCCFNLFFVISGTKCTDGTENIANGNVVEE